MDTANSCFVELTEAEPGLIYRMFDGPLPERGEVCDLVCVERGPGRVTFKLRVKRGGSE